MTSRNRDQGIQLSGQWFGGDLEKSYDNPNDIQRIIINPLLPNERRGVVQSQ